MRSTIVSVLGLRTRVLEEGQPGGRDPVILIHGVGGWAEHWAEVMEPLARTGRRVIAFDLPGFGESEAPRGVSHFGPANPFYPTFVLSLLDVLVVDAAHVVGSSMGGAVAYMTAVTAPSRTRSLALVASGGLGADLALFLRLATLPGIELLVGRFRAPRYARDVVRECFYDTERVPEHLYAEVDRWGLATFGEFARALRSGVSIGGVRRSLREYWIAQASRYRGPAIVIWGRQDAVLPVWHANALTGVLPQAEVRIIEECGHLPMAERPREFLAALLPFIESAEAAAAA